MRCQNKAPAELEQVNCIELHSNKQWAELFCAIVAPDISIKH